MEEGKMEEGKPVPEIDITFRWQTQWVPIFNKQIELIQADIERARAEDRLVVYLSCPISSRGGGYSGTNVDIARYTERRLLQEWGERFWIVNPAQYQMESKAGTGLIESHLRDLNVTAAEREAMGHPKGGDYMRMWTKVLCEDDKEDRPAKQDESLVNSGWRFDAFYFLGPTDVRHFFTQGGQQTVTAGVEAYFARRFASDPDFREAYSLDDLPWPRGTDSKLPDRAKKKPQEYWEDLRKEFFRYYAVRASVNYSLGSHDEWNIFCLLNQRRLAATVDPGMLNGDVGMLLAGYFDGRQIDPAAMQLPTSRGYAV